MPATMVPLGPNPPCGVHVSFTAAELRRFASEHTNTGCRVESGPFLSKKRA